MPQAVAIKEATQAPEAAKQPAEVSMDTAIEGIAAGAMLGLHGVTTEDEIDATSAKKFTLHVPIKARPKARVDVKDLVIHVLFPLAPEYIGYADLGIASAVQILPYLLFGLVIGARVDRLDPQTSDGHRMGVCHRARDLDAVGPDDRSTLFGQAPDRTRCEFVPVAVAPRVGADRGVDLFGLR